MKEIWKDIKGFEGKYQVSNLGRVRSLKRFAESKKEKLKRIVHPKILKPNKNTGGYLKVQLSYKGNQKTQKIHRLVAETFIPNLRKVNEINHKDGNKLNNQFTNLEWVTHKENQKHASEKLLYSRGEKHGASKLSNQDVLKIRALKNKMQIIEIAKKFNVDRTTIGKIISGHRRPYL